ncbi:alpha/beta hydrolase family protein [Sphingomonas tabacisoli]|uniref:Alpha/beta hydrolase family protein n=1 Tax=Sphingomonas tabacisoli TaxID=2249466 RepID=A0ABW4I2Z1_9SPHN
MGRREGDCRAAVKPLRRRAGRGSVADGEGTDNNVKPAGLIAALLLAPACQARSIGPDDVDRMPASNPTAVIAYGVDPLQKGELRLPHGKGPFPVAIVIHGGCWTARLATLRNTAPMASALAARGIATWNIEYRAWGNPGAGWPGTFQDWAAAADHLRELAKQYPLDLKRVAAVGHSAGGHAALWLAARRRLPADSEVRGRDPLPLKAAVAIDGPGDLKAVAEATEEFCSRRTVTRLMGGTPAETPQTYAQGSPIELLPLGVPQYFVVSQFVRAEDAAAYAKRAGGDRVETLAPKDADHFNIIAPGEPQYRQVEALILKALQ